MYRNIRRKYIASFIEQALVKFGTDASSFNRFLKHINNVFGRMDGICNLQKILAHANNARLYGTFTYTSTCRV